MNSQNPSQDNPTKIIFRAYSMGFFLLFVVIIGYQAILAVENNGNTTNAERINTAGRQRMLSQRIGKNLLWLSQLQIPQQRESVIEKIDADIIRLSANDISLKQNFGNAQGLFNVNSKLEGYYAGLTPPLLKMRLAVEQIKQLSSAKVIDEAAIEKVLQDYLANDELFLTNMDKVVLWYEYKLQKHIDHLNTLSSASAFAILLVMVFIGKYAIYKAVKLVQLLFSELVSRKELLELILHSAQEGIISINNSTQITFFNLPAEIMFGYSRQEVLGRKITDLIPDFYTHKNQDSYENPDDKTELRGYKKDNSFFPLVLKKCKNYSHEPHEFIAFVSDLTLQIQTKSALERSEEQYRAVVEDQSELICRYDSEFRLLFVNKAYCDFFKKTKEQLLGTVFINNLTDKVQTWFLKTHDSLTPDTPYQHHEDSYTNACGETEWMDWKTRAIFDNQGKLIEYQGVGSITTRRKQAELELMQATETAIEANQAKSKFLSNMSHELRTPLNAILGFTQLLETDDEQPLSEQQSEYLNYIHNAGDHLLTLIKKMLDLSEVELGDVSLSIEMVSFFDIINEALILMLPVAAQKNIQLLKTVATDLPCYVHADRIRLRQIILHLISNAIKYNHKNGYVDLKVEIGSISPALVTLSVVDNGPGISATRMKELFKPFNRLNADCSIIEGTGIGLAVSKALVEKMQGRIGVHSEIGVGSRFWISFPITQHINKNDLTDQGNLKNSYIVPESPDLQKILYIEDNPDNTRLVAAIVKRMPQFSFIDAPNAEIGLELIAQLKPAIVLMDIDLPGMNGFMAFQKIQQRFSFAKQMAIIAVSANVMPTDVEKGLKLGFFDYLTKPINIVMLQETLTSASASIDIKHHD